MKTEINSVSITKDEVDKYRRWNSLLIMEMEQNRARIRKVELVEARNTRLESDNAVLQEKVRYTRHEHKNV